MEGSPDARRFVVTSPQQLPPPVQRYVGDVVQVGSRSEAALVSAIVFGSVVTGGYTAGVSDVDMLLVVTDGSTPDARMRLRARVEQVEAAHGLRDATAGDGMLERFARTVTANRRSFFICTRADLLSGDPARILGISGFQALFVDRVVIPSMVRSAVTVSGEDLLARVPVKPIRRSDVFIALFGFWNQIVLSAVLFPFVPASTKFAMATLKRSVHNCYFCYHLRPARLADEIAFCRSLTGGGALDELSSLRAEYRPSFRFVLQCLPTLVRLHVRTAVDNPFPRAPAHAAA